ncbi:MAG: helix-turn-helix transcriptional regulator [Hyphomicrobium sp.]
MQSKDEVGAGALVDLVSDFYGASMDTRFWPTALSKLREALDANACALVTHDFTSQTGSITYAFGIDVEFILSYGEVFARSNPWLQREESFRTSGVVWAGPELVENEQATGEFAEHWLAPQGLKHQLFGVLERQANEVLYVLAARSAAAKPFGSEEGALLRRLLPYLERSLRAGQMLKRSQTVRQVALDALDVMPIGVILVSLGGAVLAANKVARDVMAGRDVLTVGRNGLEVLTEGRKTRFRDMLAQVTKPRERNRPSRPAAFSLVRPSGLRPLSLLISPVRLPAESTAWDEPAAVLFIGDPEHAGDIDETRLRQIYGLTGAEARIAALLARGYRLDEIAAMLEVAYETTRKHLKQIFGKTGTGRQADLVRMVMLGPGGLVP